MHKLLRAGALVVLLTGGGVGKAIALEITQPEAGTPITACVQVFNEATANNTPVLASDCGNRFSSYWH